MCVCGGVACACFLLACVYVSVSELNVLGQWESVEITSAKQPVRRCTQWEDYPLNTALDGDRMASPPFNHPPTTTTNSHTSLYSLDPPAQPNHPLVWRPSGGPCSQNILSCKSMLIHRIVLCMIVCVYTRSGFWLNTVRLAFDPYIRCPSRQQGLLPNKY